MFTNDETDLENKLDKVNDENQVTMSDSDIKQSNQKILVYIETLSALELPNKIRYEYIMSTKEESNLESISATE